MKVYILLSNCGTYEPRQINGVFASVDDAKQAMARDMAPESAARLQWFDAEGGGVNGMWIYATGAIMYAIRPYELGELVP